MSNNNTTYKDSPLGKIPIDWEVVKIKDIGTISSGTTPLRSNMSFHKNGTIHWVKTTDLNNSIILATEEKITEKALNETSLRIYSKGTVLVAMYGGFNQIGRTGLLGIDATINQALSAITVNRDIINPIFLLEWFNGNIGLWKNLAGSSRKDPNITSKDVGDFPIIKISLHEQTRIAEVLNTWDNAISQNNQIIAQKELQKKWLMQNLLTGKKRLNGFSEDWKEIRLGDIGEIKTSSVDKVVEEGEAIVNLINYMDVYRNRFITPDFPCKKTSANEREMNTFNLKKGDILFTPSSETPDDIGHSAVVTADLENTVYSYHLVRFRLFEESSLAFNFRAYVFNNQNILNEFSRCATGSTRFTISKSDFEEIKAKIPKILEEQTAIAKVLQAADKEIQLLKNKTEQLKEQKKGLMQVLLTGKKRLKINN